MSLNRRDTVLLRTGLPGSGKSWSLARYIVTEWIPDHRGIVYTNVPLNVEAIADHFAKRAKPHERERVREEVRSRIQLFPAAVEELWLEGLSQPGEYFDGLWKASLAEVGLKPLASDATEAAKEEYADLVQEHGLVHPLSKALVVIDETGKMFMAEPEKERKPQIAAVKSWLATLRHYGARACFVSQDEMQVNIGIRRLAAVEILCTKMNTQPEPLTGALLDHWFQLFAKFTGIYPVWMREEEFVREGKEQISVRVWSGFLSSFFFKFYNSHNNARGEVSGQEELPEYKRFGLGRFLWWLLKQNAFNWGWRFCLVLFFYSLFAPPFSFAWRAVTWVSVYAATAGQSADWVPGVGKAGAGQGSAAGSPDLNSSLNKGEVGAGPAQSSPPPLLPPPPVVVGIVGQVALLSDGSEVTIGESFNGLRVVGMDAVGRVVDLSDGSRVRLRDRPAVRVASEGNTAIPSMVGATPQGRAASRAPGANVGPGATSQPDAQGRAAGARPASPGDGIRGLDGSAGIVPDAPGMARTEGPTAGGRSLAPR